MATAIITDGSTDRVREAPRVVLPARSGLFSQRAERFEQLAPGNSLGDYLRLLARIARAQEETLARHGAEGIPAQALTSSRDFGMPPLGPQIHRRSAQWRADLSAIATQVGADISPAVKSVLERLAVLPTAALDDLADRVLGGTLENVDAALAPWLGAALQTYYTRLAATLAPADVEHCDVPDICPVCASRPLASVVQLEPVRAGLRYLVCSLCAAEWRVARIRCTSCEAEGSVKYLALQAEGERAPQAAIRAEACDDCKSYLKIFYPEKDPALEPTADDLASLALDLKMDEEGYMRSGPNLLLHPGSG